MTEYWTVDQVAEFWGVSPSRARALIARATLQKRTVYVADEVRAIPRLKQGTRTDLHKGAAIENTDIATLAADYDTTE